MSSLLSDLQYRFLSILDTWYGLVISLIIVYALAVKVQQIYIAKKLGCKPPQSAPISFSLGFLPAFQLLKKKKAGELNQFNRERFESLGETAVVPVAGVQIVITRDPENIKAILGTQFNDFDLGIRHRQFLPLLGDGIFTLDNQGWKHSRAMLRPQFAREQVAHVKMLEPHVQNLFAHVKKNGGQEFDIQEYFFRLTLDSATEFLFGESVESLCDSSIHKTPAGECDITLKMKFADSFNYAQSTLATRAVLQKLYFIISGKKFKESCSDVHRLTEFFVDKALQTPIAELDEKLKGGYIFLFELVKQTRDPRILRDQALNILLAGRDTTAGLLSFAFFELARNPKIFEKLKEEVYEAFGSGENVRIEDITFESLKKCEYLKAVVNETLRMYPSVPQNFRVANKYTSLPRGGGKDGQSPLFIKKNQTVSYSIYSTQRNEKTYGPDAHQFRPERWFEDSTRKLGWAYLPFNGGPRICLGQQFALTEASYVIARLVQEFPNLVSYDDQYPPAINSQLTACLLNGAKIGMY